MTFTMDNTNGFNSDDLDVLNEALATLKQLYPAVEEYTISDLLNNHWIDGVTPEELVARIQLDLG